MLDARGFNYRVLEGIHDLLEANVLEESSPKAIREVLALTDSLTHTFIRFAEAFDPSPKAATYWKENLPPDIKIKFVAVTRWSKMLHATYDEVKT